MLLIVKRLSLSRIIYAVGGDTLPIFDDFFDKDPCLQQKYAQAKADKPRLADGMTSEMSEMFDLVAKVRGRKL